jgi:hypothetical protein
MGRNVPPVKVDWGLGCNKELCEVLKQCKEEYPDSGISHDTLIAKIEKYGHVAEDNNGKYDLLYLYEWEASQIIYALIYHILSLEVTLKHEKQFTEALKSVLENQTQLIEKQEKLIDTQDKTLEVYESVFENEDDEEMDEVSEE